MHFMRHEDNTPKGCAFIKFKFKEHAILAIRDLNAQAYICNSLKPLEVRFAENKQRRMQFDRRTE